MGGMYVGEWSASRPGRFTAGEKNPGTHQIGGWVGVWITWRGDNSWPYRDSNSNPSVFQPVASRYTDYAIPAPIFFGLV
jgi:murein endopeptidase